MPALTWVFIATMPLMCTLPPGTLVGTWRVSGIGHHQVRYSASGSMAPYFILDPPNVVVGQAGLAQACGTTGNLTVTGQFK